MDENIASQHSDAGKNDCGKSTPERWDAPGNCLASQARQGRVGPGTEEPGASEQENSGAPDRGQPLSPPGGPTELSSAANATEAADRPSSDIRSRSGALKLPWMALKSDTGFWLWAGDPYSEIAAEVGEGVAYVSFAVDLTADEGASLMRVIEKAPELLEELRTLVGACPRCDGDGIEDMETRTEIGYGPPDARGEPTPVPDLVAVPVQCQLCYSARALIARIDGKESCGGASA